MVEIYCGEGKGKTTAAVGLALRAAGNGLKVLFVQFMKDGSSGEVKALKGLPEVSVYYPKVFYGFARTMNSRQKEEMKLVYAGLLETAFAVLKAHKNACTEPESQREEKAGKMFTESTAEGTEEIRLVIILDEVIHACNKGLLEEAELIMLLEECPGDTEIVLTGREPSGPLMEKADYISEIKKIRHPFDKGVPSRKGIEL